MVTCRYCGKEFQDPDHEKNCPNNPRMSERIDLHGIEGKLGEIAQKLNKPYYEIMNEFTMHNANIEKQNELIKEQISLVKWTRALAIFTIIMAIGTIGLAIETGLMVSYQTPVPNLKLNVWEIPPAGCVNNISFPYGPDVEIANVGTRTSFNTQLIITYKKPNSFYDAYFFKPNRTVNRTNPIANWTSLYPPEVTIIGYPYWIVYSQSTTIFLNQIEPGETLDMAVRFNGQCGTSKDVQFKVMEEGYGKSSDVKTLKLTWVNAILPAGK